jgi:hypothetical protein
MSDINQAANLLLFMHRFHAMPEELRQLAVEQVFFGRAPLPPDPLEQILHGRNYSTHFRDETFVQMWRALPKDSQTIMKEYATITMFESSHFELNLVRTIIAFQNPAASAQSLRPETAGMMRKLGMLE